MTYTLTHLQSLALYSKPLPSRLEPLTLAVIKCLTFGMYRKKIEHRLQLHIIKYILSQKLEKYIKSIKHKIDIADNELDKEYQFLEKSDRITIRLSYSDEIKDQERAREKHFRYMKANQVKYNELVFGFKYNIYNFNVQFIIEYKFYCDNGYLLPRQQIIAKGHYTLIAPEDLEILIHTPLKKKNNELLEFYNQELESSEKDKLHISVIYDFYKEWCKNYNKKCFSSRTFEENLKLNNFEIKNHYLLGVKIREYEEED